MKAPTRPFRFGPAWQSRLDDARDDPLQYRQTVIGHSRGTLLLWLLGSGMIEDNEFSLPAGSKMPQNRIEDAPFGQGSLHLLGGHLFSPRVRATVLLPSPFAGAPEPRPTNKSRGHFPNRRLNDQRAYDTPRPPRNPLDTARALCPSTPMAGGIHSESRFMGNCVRSGTLLFQTRP